MGNITESIWSGKDWIIPLASVSHVQKRDNGRLYVSFTYSVYDEGTGEHEPGVLIPADDADKFLRAWYAYRGEVDNVLVGYDDEKDLNQQEKEIIELLKMLVVSIRCLQEQNMD